jgi:hypothetical protein
LCLCVRAFEYTVRDLERGRFVFWRQDLKNPILMDDSASSGGVWWGTPVSSRPGLTPRRHCESLLAFATDLTPSFPLQATTSSNCLTAPSRLPARWAVFCWSLAPLELTCLLPVPRPASADLAAQQQQLQAAAAATDKYVRLCNTAADPSDPVVLLQLS